MKIRIPKTKAEAAALAKAAGGELADWLDGVDDDKFDGEEFMRRLRKQAGTDWPATVITWAFVILAWEVGCYVVPMAWRLVFP